MKWIKYCEDSKPTTSGKYLCIVVSPEGCGKYSIDIQSIYYYEAISEWMCADMIVVYWAEMPELPKEIIL